jgi:hypothetical protein
MTLELPVLRLGLAGFTADEQLAVERMLATSAGEELSWAITEVDAADALWFNGARTQVVGAGRVRVSPGVPSAHALQVQMSEIDRPVAIAQPLPQDLTALCTFDLASRDSMAAALAQLETWLAPLVAQFSLAAHIAEHQAALGRGVFELRLNSDLLAVVDMHGEAAVRSTAEAEEFESGALWQRSQGTAVPEDFVRTSLSQLMWQYAVRTQRDLLPRHYRTGMIYYRRPPRLPQQYLKDAHLLIMRELMLAPANFQELAQRCAIGEDLLARELAALYFVGTITSNPKRAAPAFTRHSESEAEAGAPSHLNLDSIAPSELPGQRRPVNSDLTAPAPLRPDH